MKAETVFHIIGAGAAALFLAVMFSLLTGCAGSGVVRLHFEPTDGGLVGEDPVRLSSIEMDPELYGRGCIAMEVSDDGGTVKLAIQQDGTSDWAGIRAVYGMAPEIVEAAVQVVSGPMDIFKGVLGLEQRDMQEPSPQRGCAGLFVQD